MRFNLRKLSIPFVIVIYLMAFLGFGVHTCSTSGTQDLILLVGDVSCEEIHHHHHTHSCDHSDCGDHHHDGNCCHTEVYEVSDEQTSEIQLAVSAPLPMTLINRCRQSDFVKSVTKEETGLELITPPLTIFAPDLASISLLRI